MSPEGYGVASSVPFTVQTPTLPAKTNSDIELLITVGPLVKLAVMVLPPQLPPGPVISRLLNKTGTNVPPALGDCGRSARSIVAVHGKPSRLTKPQRKPLRLPLLTLTSTSPVPFISASPFNSRVQLIAGQPGIVRALGPENEALAGRDVTMAPFLYICICVCCASDGGYEKDKFDSFIDGFESHEFS